MAFGPWTLTQSARAKLLTGQFDLDSDAWKVALFASTSNLGAASTTFASVTDEIGAVNGYTAGGQAVTLTVTGTTIVNVAFAANPVWLADGGSITANKAGLYEVGGDVFAYCLLNIVDGVPVDKVTTDGNELRIDNDGTPYPILTLS